MLYIIIYIYYYTLYYKLQKKKKEKTWMEMDKAFVIILCNIMI